MTADARIQELEEKLARVSQERDRLARERDEYRKLYELVMLELERVRRHLRAQNKSERVDAAQVQLAFAEIANNHRAAGVGRTDRRCGEPSA